MQATNRSCSFVPQHLLCASHGCAANCDYLSAFSPFSPVTSPPELWCPTALQAYNSCIFLQHINIFQTFYETVYTLRILLFLLQLVWCGLQCGLPSEVWTMSWMWLCRRELFLIWVCTATSIILWICTWLWPFDYFNSHGQVHAIAIM